MSARPHPPRQRLSSLKDAGKTRPIGASLPRKPPKKKDCCSSPDVQDVDGVMACINCGSLQSESNIVAEVTFGETSAGAAMVQGGTVNEDQRHANTMGSAARRIGLGASGPRASEQNGRDAIRGLATSMRISGFIEDQAVNIYRILSLNYNFLAGRRPPTVAACCLYASARMQPGSKLLLIDFAEKIKVNVFKLGEVYKTMCDQLMVPELQNQQRIEPEPLVQKYVQKLEFGPAGERRVAEDAIKLLQRMKRDWMVEGRQLAGICGACIVLAARMNNFRRTVREVVYVVKVADMTIAKRLVEFKRTTSARLSVDQFRRVGEKVRGEVEPPAMYQAREREKKRRKISRSSGRESSIASQDGPALDEQDAASGTTGARGPRRDADGFAIPDIPRAATTLSLAAAVELAERAERGSEEEAASPPKKKRGRPRKEKIEPVQVEEEDLIIEREIQTEIDRIMHDPETINNMEELEYAALQARAKALATQLQGTSQVAAHAEIEEHEFDNDPEVANCLLSPEEIIIKERIWVTHNEDWLRAQQARMLKKSLEEANGGPKKRVTRKKKADALDGERDSPAASPADAAARMMQRRGKGFSKNINYEKLNAIMKNSSNNEKEASASASTSVRPSNAGSPAPSVQSTYSDESESHPTGAVLQTPPATQQPAVSGAATGEQREASQTQRPEAEEPEEDNGDDVEEEVDEDVEDDDQEEEDYSRVINPLYNTGAEEFQEEYEGMEEWE